MECFGDTEALPRYRKSCCPRAGISNLHQFPVIDSFSCILFLIQFRKYESKIVIFFKALYFYSSVRIYAFIHNVYMTPFSFIIDKILMTSFKYDMTSFKSRESSYTPLCRMSFTSTWIILSSMQKI